MNFAKQMRRVHPADNPPCLPDYHPQLHLTQKKLAVSVPNYQRGAQRGSVFGGKSKKELAFVFDYNNYHMGRKQCQIMKT